MGVKNLAAILTVAAGTSGCAGTNVPFSDPLFNGTVNYNGYETASVSGSYKDVAGCLSAGFETARREFGGRYADALKEAGDKSSALGGKAVILPSVAVTCANGTGEGNILFLTPKDMVPAPRR